MSTKSKIAAYKKAALAGEELPKIPRPVALKYHCLECSGGERANAIECDVKMCMLYQHNPWRKLAGKRAKRKEEKANKLLLAEEESDELLDDEEPADDPEDPSDSDT